MFSQGVAETEPVVEETPAEAQPSTELDGLQSGSFDFLTQS
jgi:hypothetical protein